MEVRFRSSDGITAPIAVTNSYSLTSSVHGTTYGLGRGYIDGAEISPLYLMGIVVNPGIQLTIQRSGGGVFPTAHYIQYRAPTIDFMVEDASLAYSFINRYGTGNVTCSAFFRARKDGSVYELDASASHLKFSFAASLSRMEVLEAAQSGNGSVTLRCHGKSLVSTTGVAIA